MIFVTLIAALNADPTAMTTEACSRRMAQLAASHRIVDLTARVVSPATVRRDGRYQILLDVSIRYPHETKRAVIACIVSRWGKVQALEGLKPIDQ